MTNSLSRSKKFGIALAGTMLAGTLTFAATASAAGNEGDNGNGRRVERVCARADEIDAHFARVHARLDRLSARLDAAKARAEAAGNTERVQRIEAAQARLGERLAAVDARQAKFETWTAEHCTTTAG